MLIPWPVIVIVAFVIAILIALTLLSMFAWYGIAKEHQELLDRVKVMQIDVYDLKTPLRRLGEQVGQFGQVLKP